MPDARASGPVIIDSHDLDEITTQLERCNTELIQLGGGPMHLSAMLLPLGFMYVASVRAGCAIVLRGAVPDGWRLVLQTSPASAPLRIGSQSIVRDECIFARSRAQLAIYLPENCSAYAFCIANGAGEPTGRPRAEIRTPAPEHLAALRGCIALLDRGSDVDVRRSLQELLLPAASSLWAHASEPLPQPSGRIVRVCAVMRACAYIDVHLNKPLTLRELCDAAGVRARTLEYGFRECYDVGPMTYLRSVRLCRVRRDLSKAQARAASVGEIAHKWCFSHMGQFGRDYRILFGEAPSMTLARARQNASQRA